MKYNSVFKSRHRAIRPQPIKGGSEHSLTVLFCFVLFCFVLFLASQFLTPGKTALRVRSLFVTQSLHLLSCNLCLWAWRFRLEQHIRWAPLHKGLPWWLRWLRIYLPAMQKTQVRSLGQEDLLKKRMATHSSILAWRILWTEEPGRLQSMGLQRIPTWLSD